MCNLGIGVVLLVVYFLLSQNKWALIILFFAGFTVSSSLPLLVVMARHTGGRLVIGLKMGIMVGGAWGCAGLVLFGVSFFVEEIGLLNVMKTVCSLYIAAFVLAVLTAFVFKNGKQVESELQTAEITE
jgi:hypothetical protein